MQEKRERQSKTEKIGEVRWFLQRIIKGWNTTGVQTEVRLYVMLVFIWDYHAHCTVPELKTACAHLLKKYRNYILFPRLGIVMLGIYFRHSTMINTPSMKYNLSTLDKSLAAFCKIEWNEFGIKDNIMWFISMAKTEQRLNITIIKSLC